MRKTYRYRLYPNRAQGEALESQLAEACRLYNGALQERRDAWRMRRVSVNYYDQANQLKQIRADGDLGLANFSSCQDVLRRVDKAFRAFFKRVANGRKPGFPRFRPLRRFDSFTFPSYGDGCRLRADGGLLDSNPAAPVHGPKVVVRKGKTPVLDADQTRALLDSPSLTNITGLRDRALIGTMLYTFGRVSAVVGMDVEDYFLDGRRWTFRLHEKGGKFHTVPAHHAIVDCLGDYLDASGLADQPKAPLFQSVGPKRQLTGRRLLRQNAWHVIKRRALQASLPLTTRCHTMRATGITNYLQNGGNLEFARALAAHESSQTTRLYDHSDDDLSLDEIERIRF